MNTELKNFHVPLPQEMYRRLQEEARLLNSPATQVAREAIAAWLKERQHQAQTLAIRAYAQSVAGSPEDFDSEFSAASLELWAEEDA